MVDLRLNNPYFTRIKAVKTPKIQEQPKADSSGDNSDDSPNAGNNTGEFNSRSKALDCLSNMNKSVIGKIKTVVVDKSGATDSTGPDIGKFLDDLNKILNERMRPIDLPEGATAEDMAAAKEAALQMKQEKAMAFIQEFIDNNKNDMPRGMDANFLYQHVMALRDTDMSKDEMVENLKDLFSKDYVVISINEGKVYGDLNKELPGLNRDVKNLIVDLVSPYIGLLGGFTCNAHQVIEKLKDKYPDSKGADLVNTLNSQDIGLLKKVIVSIIDELKAEFKPYYPPTIDTSATFNDNPTLD